MLTVSDFSINAFAADLRDAKKEEYSSIAERISSSTNRPFLLHEILLAISVPPSENPILLRFRLQTSKPKCLQAKNSLVAAKIVATMATVRKKVFEDRIKPFHSLAGDP